MHESDWALANLDHKRAANLVFCRSPLQSVRLQLLLWSAWWLLTRSDRAHAWRAPALHLALAAAAALELIDFPPVLGALDAHALWHLLTAPLALAFWWGFVVPELACARRCALSQGVLKKGKRV